MVVERKGIDMVAKLFGADGQKLAEVANDPAVGREFVSVVAEAAGAYRLEVRWKVSDKATAELMQRFYQQMLKDGRRPAAALRAAQVSMLKEKQWAAAYYWAGFVRQGEWK